MFYECNWIQFIYYIFKYYLVLKYIYKMYIEPNSEYKYILIVT